MPRGITAFREYRRTGSQYICTRCMFSVRRPAGNALAGNARALAALKQHFDETHAPTVVEVVDADEDIVVKTLGPMPAKDADKAQLGLDRNLNHDRFYTRTRTVKEGE